MPRLRPLVKPALFTVFACATVWNGPLGAQSGSSESYVWSLPKGFPKPRVPADNPMTAAKVELGRHLFYDTRMSVNGGASCATCHKQELAFTDGRAVSVGATGEKHSRGAMSLVNVAYNAVLTWSNPDQATGATGPGTDVRRASRNPNTGNCSTGRFPNRPIVSPSRT